MAQISRIDVTDAEQVVDWHNGPSGGTPISASNLNKINLISAEKLNYVIDSINALEIEIGDLAKALANLNDGEGV